jgi:OmpA-OmpF porin, OOP family
VQATKTLIAVAAVLAAAAGCTHTKRVVAPSYLPSAGEPWSRASEKVIGADLAYFDKLRARWTKLDQTEKIPPYHLAKARAWLDLAQDEYENNDRSPVIENATAQAEILIGALEMKSDTINPETPLVPGSERIREDLWQKAARAKEDTRFGCVAPTVARLEVQLVWAGHELAQAGWRNASSYVQTAEDLGQRLDKQLAQCPASS